MNKFNTVYLNDGFTKESMAKYYFQIDKLTSDPLIIYISGPGGSVQKMLTIADIVVSLDVPITVISREVNASACARFPHVVDFVRLGYTNSRFIYHNGIFVNEGPLGELEANLERHRLTTEHKIKALMENVGLTRREAVKYDDKDISLTAQQALMVGKHGMIDGIIIKDFRDGRFLIKTRDGNKEIDVTKHRRSDLINIPPVL